MEQMQVILVVFVEGRRMANTANVKLHKSIESEIINSFQNLSEEYADLTFELSVSVIDDTVLDAGSNSDFTKLIAKSEMQNYILTNKNLSKSFRFIAKAQNNNQVFALSIARDPHFDSLTITYSNNPANINEKLKLYERVQKHFPFYEGGDVSAIIGTELKGFYEKRDESLVRLEQFNKNFTIERVKQQQALEKEFRDKEKELKEHYNKLEEDLKTEIEEEKIQIGIERAELEILRLEIDDLDNTASRRKLRSDLKDELKERSKSFKLSSTTNLKRYPIHILFIALITILIMQVYTSIVVHGAVSEVTRLTLLGLKSLALAFTIFYYIRWIDKWAKVHADEEFKLKKLDLDIDRASWVVETVLEWNNATSSDEQIPLELLQKLTTNLFEYGESSECTKHPTEEIVKAILNASASLNLRTPVGDLSLDNKGLKKVTKEIQNVVKQ